MATILTRFIGTNGITTWFPIWDPEDGQDMGGYTTHALPLSGGGVYDPDDTRPPRGLRKIARRGVLRETSKRALQDAYEALAVASGTRGKVYRQTESGDRSDWITARLTVEPEDRTPQISRVDDGRYVMAMPITLELQDKTWHGMRHGTALTPLDSGYSLDVGVPLDDTADTTVLDTSPKTIAVTNDGNMPCDDPVLSLTVAGTDLTLLIVQAGKAAFSLTGTFKVGNTVIVDAGNALVAHQTVLTAPAAIGATALTVANAAGTGWATGGRIRIVLDDGSTVERAITSIGGTTTVNISPGLPWGAASGREVQAAAYSAFARDVLYHRIDTWLRLDAGTNSVIVTRTGGAGSALTFSFFDSWA